MSAARCRPVRARNALSTAARFEQRRKVHAEPFQRARFPLTEARRAHELLESSASKGRLVLVP